MKQIHYRFKHAGIVIPMPIRALQLGSAPDSGRQSFAAEEVTEMIRELRALQQAVGYTTTTQPKVS
jgi:hypothetical protein